MNIKVNFSELEEVERIQKNNQDLLYQEIERLLKSLERLKSIWNGEDFERFYENAYNYISRMKVLCSFMDTMSEVMKNASELYKEQDENCSNSLKEEEAILDEKNRNTRL